MFDKRLYTKNWKIKHKEEVRNYQRNWWSKYKDRKTLYESHLEKHILTCANCNKKFETIWKHRLKFENNFCNLRCLTNFRVRKGTMPHRKTYIVSKETRKKISQRMKGKRNSLGTITSLETRLKQSKAHKGEKSSLWLGGNKNIRGYTPLFNKQLKERIRVRDGFKCQLCGVPELECKKRLAVHHIDFNKENCSEGNLISLCNSCHNKTKVKQHQEYFRKLLVGR